MSYTYDPSNKFGYKDTLPEGSDEKVIRGTDFDVEFKKIESAFLVLDPDGDGDIDIDGIDGLQEALDKEKQERVEADANLQGQVDSLEEDLSTETQARIAGDDALDLRIDAVEDSIGEGGGFVDAPNDAKLYGRQSEAWAEVVIPEGYDDTQIKADLTTETQARTDGDAALQTQIDNFENYDDTQIKADLTTETQARIGGDAGLQTQIDNLDLSGAVEEAPEDGKQYARKDAGWSEVQATGGASQWDDVTGGIAFMDGAVGIGMEPDTTTSDLTAKEQLAEWKTKAKASTWEQATQGEFSEEPTEEALAEWMDVRAAGDLLQVAGNISASNYVKAKGLRATNEGTTQIELWDSTHETGKKFIRSSGGAFDVVCHDYSTSIFRVDDNGDVRIIGDLKLVGTSIDAKNATFSGSVTANTVTAYSSVSANSVNVTDSVSANSVVATDSVTSDTVVTNSVTADSVDVSSVTATGSVSADSVNVTGTVYAAQSYLKGANGARTVWEKTGSYSWSTGIDDEVYFYINGGGVANDAIRIEPNSNNATFSGNVDAAGFTINGQPISGGSDYDGADAVKLTGDQDIAGSKTFTSTVNAPDFVSSSDERFKTSIATAPCVIDQLHGREWEWKDSGKKGSGVIAQELEQVLPHLVHEDDEGMKSVAYNGLVAYLIEEVKALRTEVEALKA